MNGCILWLPDTREHKSDTARSETVAFGAALAEHAREEGGWHAVPLFRSRATGFSRARMGSPPTTGTGCCLRQN